jgi:hypothetical protein
MLSDLAGRYTAEEMKQVADALDEAARDAGLWDDSEQGE